jgi:corrinoid protein of di/trimethylamine methyltransferase
MMSDRESILKGLYSSVVEGEEEAAAEFAEQSIAAGIPALEALDQGLTPGIREIGDRFGRMEAFLPEMVLAAKAMEAAVKVLEPHLDAKDTQKKAKIVLGTIKGDIHDIGKNIVSSLLKVNGYEVFDLGKDIPSASFISKAKEVDADLIGLSGLLTTSLPMMQEVIEFLEEDGLRDKYKVVIGGGPTSQEFADEIKADGYANTAADAVVLCDRLFG